MGALFVRYLCTFHSYYNRDLKLFLFRGCPLYYSWTVSVLDWQASKQVITRIYRYVYIPRSTELMCIYSKIALPSVSQIQINTRMRTSTVGEKMCKQYDRRQWSWPEVLSHISMQLLALHTPDSHGVGWIYCSTASIYWLFKSSSHPLFYCKFQFENYAQLFYFKFPMHMYLENCLKIWALIGNCIWCAVMEAFLSSNALEEAL